MSKWALWAAHRYLHPGAAEPRVVGVDGRLLLRPWRQRSPAAVEAALLVRAARPRPWWPRLLGFALLAVAGIYAFDPVGPWERDVGARRRTGPGRPSAQLRPLAPSGEVDAAAAAGFSFAPGDAAAPFTVVLLDASYGEIWRQECADGVGCSLPSAAGKILEVGQTYHWYVLADRDGKPVASPVVSFQIR